MQSFAKVPHSAKRASSPQRREAAPRSVLHAPQRLMRAACSCGGTCPHCRGEAKNAAMLQPKLTVNEPGDAFEQEADRVADQVMRMAEPTEQVAPNPPAKTTSTLRNQRRPSLLYRKCACGGSSGACADCTAEREDKLNRREADQRGPAKVAIEAPLLSLDDGVPLPPSERAFFEPRFGYDFSTVRVHIGAQADEAARAINSLAYTRGTDVVFATGQYDPYSSAGRRLIAHELTHVIQQGELQADRLQRHASYGTLGPDPRGILEEESQKIFIAPSPDTADTADTADIQRQPQDAGVGRTDAGTPDAGTPSLATPSLNMTPGAQLTRGDTLTAAVNFTPNAGEALNVTAWRYVTPAQGTVTRAATDADFQRRWSGVMALTGTLEMDYTVTPHGKTPAPATLSQSVTVNDRTGAPWAATPTLQNEVTFAGQPSPPQFFNQLGRHEVSAPALPTPHSTNIAAGPNAQFTFVDTVTQGTYVSQPKIHPDLTNATSRFHRFHLDPSRLYLVAGASRTLIPLTEYSGLSVAGGILTFNVPNWEAFYKRHHFLTVTASDLAGGPDVALRDAWWGLATNAQNGTIVTRNDAAIRQALSISSTAGFNLNVQSAAWNGFQLMQAPAILAGTRSHEYQHAVHSHRANFQAMLRALDPQRKVESAVSTPALTINFGQKISTWWGEIIKPNHELVDETASRQQEQFVPQGGVTMAGVNTDPSTGAFLGSVWNITADQQMS